MHRQKVQTMLRDRVVMSAPGKAACRLSFRRERERDRNYKSEERERGL